MTDVVVAMVVANPILYTPSRQRRWTIGAPIADRNGTTHSYSYDELGRLTLDSATIISGSVDTAIRALGYTYDTAGRPFQFTSYANADGTGIVNQVRRQYNGLDGLNGT